MFHDTHVHKWHPPTQCHTITGTWANAAGAVGNVIVHKKTANAETSILTIPLELPMNDGPIKGAYLISVDVYTQQLSAATTTTDAAIHRVTTPVHGAAIGAIEVLPFAYDTGNDTAGERDDQDEHCMTLTLTDPVWVEDDHVIQVQLTFVCGGAVVVDYIGARANYTYRL